MSKTADYAFNHLSPAAARLGTLMARPKTLAIASVVALAAFGWLYLGLLITRMGGTLAALGPGMRTLDLVPHVFAALCRPTFGLSMLAGTWDAGSFLTVTLMWVAMVLAMMLPSAGPMILTYAEIAETAAHKRERVVSPLVIAAGYCVVWFGFALAATLAQFVFMRAAWLDGDMASASLLFSGAIFIGAGLYQFSSLKQACLKQCQNPFSFFFTRWQTTVRGVFRLGLRQGLYCLGCCWATMAVMFAVGVMNVIWMAALGIVMTLEKMLAGRRFTHVAGVGLIAAGIFFVAAAIPWPLNPF